MQIRKPAKRALHAALALSDLAVGGSVHAQAMLASASGLCVGR